MKSIQQQKQLKKYFNRYKIGNGIFTTDAIQYLDDLKQIIQSKLLMFYQYNNELANTKHITFYLKLMLEVITKLNDETNLSLIMKKIFILYTSINIIAAKNLFSEQIQKTLNGQINKIIKQDMVNIFAKKRNSLTKIIGYIKEFSLSKDKNNGNYSKQKIENGPDKGAFKQIIAKVISPFCMYLLKIVQDNNEYSIIKKKVKQQDDSILWKMINWSKSLGQIITAVFKFSRYIKSDVTSTFLLISCLCSKEIGVFYDCLNMHCQVQALEWMTKIQNYMNVEKKSNSIHSDTIFNNPKFLNLKGYIEELSAIKQILLYLFGNRQFKSWVFYFYKPQSNKGNKNNKLSEIFQFILKFSKKIEKQKRKADSMKKVDKSSQKYIMLCQTEEIYSKELLWSFEIKDQQNQKLKTQTKTDETQQYGNLQFNELSPLPKKTRLHWNNNETIIRKNNRLNNQPQRLRKN